MVKISPMPRWSCWATARRKMTIPPRRYISTRRNCAAGKYSPRSARRSGNRSRKSKRFCRIFPHRACSSCRCSSAKVTSATKSFRANSVFRNTQRSTPCRVKAERRPVNPQLSTLNPQPACLPSRQRQRKEKLAGSQMGRVDSTGHGGDQLGSAVGWR